MEIVLPDSFLGAFLQASIGALAIRALGALGIGYISYMALTAIIGQAIAMAQGKFFGLPSAILNIVSLGGLGEALGIISAAITFRVSMMAQRKVLGVINK